MLILEIFSGWDIKKSQFQFLVVFFRSVNYTILVSKLWLVFHLKFMAMLEILSCWDIKKGHFQFLATFSAVLFWSVNCTNCFIWGFLVFSCLVFSVFKYLKSIFSSNFSWSENVTVLVCKLYMPGLYITLLLWICPKFCTIFIFEWL